METSSIIAISAALAVAITGVGTAISQGKAASKAMESMARQPEVSGKINTAMIIALAMMEALTIYGLLVAIMLIGKIA